MATGWDWNQMAVIPPVLDKLIRAGHWLSSPAIVRLRTLPLGVDLLKVETREQSNVERHHVLCPYRVNVPAIPKVPYSSS